MRVAESWEPVGWNWEWKRQLPSVSAPVVGAKNGHTVAWMEKETVDDGGITASFVGGVNLKGLFFFAFIQFYIG